MLEDNESHKECCEFTRKMINDMLTNEIAWGTFNIRGVVYTPDYLGVTFQCKICKSICSINVEVPKE